MPLARIPTPAGPRWVVRADGGSRALPSGLDHLLSLPLEEARRLIEAAADPVDDPGPVLVPVEGQEVWACGVTYLQSRDGRREESREPTIYERVYTEPRPEVFFKAAPGRSVGPDEPVGIRADSGWDVPEPELALVVNSAGELFGYTVGNDMSSRSIEGDNPLYLPQAKVYTASCALGPVIVPVWEAPEWPFGILLSIERDGAVVFTGETSTGQLARDPADLVEALTRALDFPVGAVLLTGAGIVPGTDFTLAVGDRVSITIEGIGTLANPVKLVGRPAPQTARVVG